MKKCVAMLLALALTVSLVPAALAAEPVTPTPPEWINEEDYIVFPGDVVYEPEKWANIEALREKARSGAKLKRSDVGSETFFDSAGTCYEVGLLRMKYAENVGLDTSDGRYALYAAGQAFWYAQLKYWKENGNQKDAVSNRLEVERLRAYAVGSIRIGVAWAYRLNPALSGLGMTRDDFFAGQYMYLIKPEVKEEIIAALDQIVLVLDGELVDLDVSPEVKNQRTMVPVRAVGEAIGADVEWIQETKQVVMTRAGSTVTMTLDSTTADIDGEKVEMDVAPYAIDGRTLLPARYVAEFFGQKVEWNGETRQVLISEDKSVARDSNLEAWALPMGAMLAEMNDGDPSVFGEEARTAKVAKNRNYRLNGGSWNIPDREDLANTVLSMTMYGHDATFREMAADVKLRTPEERAEISAASTAWPDYMWEYTEQLDEKWGEKGIMAWDLFRMSNLVQWGYTAGYVTYAEALELLEPAATILCDNFSSWDEAYENYLDGYNWWARNDVLGQDIWQTERGKKYRDMKEDEKIGPIFDDTLFQTGVISLPGNEG